MKWNRISEILPAHGQKIIVYCDGNYEIGEAEIYKEQPRWYEHSTDYRLTPEEIANLRRIDNEQIGRLRFFGHRYYFNNKNLYWMPVPDAPTSDDICGAW